MQTLSMFKYLLGFLGTLALTLGAVFFLTSGNSVVASVPYWLVATFSVLALAGTAAFLGALFMKKTAKVNREVNEDDDSRAELGRFAEPQERVKTRHAA